jgi:uncharacterized delta-60 repeat protein
MLRCSLRALSGLFTSTRRPTRARLGIETLERRELMAAGAFDLTFGPSHKGLVAADFADTLPGSTAQASAVTLQKDGHIVLAGTVSTPDGTDCMAVVRLNRDGSYDSTFGSSGRQYLDFSDLLGSTSAHATAVAVDGNGDIVVAGTASAGDGSNFVVARLTSDGTYDSSFGQGGRQYFTFSDLTGGTVDTATSLVLDAQGDIVVAGSAQTTDDGSVMAVARLTSDGSFDPSFGIDGRQYLTFSDLTGGSACCANAVAIDSQERIVLAGQDVGPGGSSFAAARLNADGSFDASFGIGGRQYFTFSDWTGAGSAEGSAVAIDSQGRIVLAGTATDDLTGRSWFALGRLTSSGWFDQGFGLGGREYFTFSDRTGGAGAQASAVTLDEQGHILVAGSAQTSSSTWVGAVARLNDNGSFDTHFGLGGRQVLTDGEVAGSSSLGVAAMALDALGQVVLAGADSTSSQSWMAVARLDGDPTRAANQLYVGAVFQALLHHPVDAAVVTAFSDRLDRGESRSVVVAQIVGLCTSSGEGELIEVNDLYQHYLHRAPSPLDQGSWVGFVQSGASPEQVAALLIGSAEYYQTRGGNTDAGFIAAVYQDVLGRAPAAGEPAVWMARVASGPVGRQQMAQMLLSSFEYRWAQVDGYFQRFLGRSVNGMEGTPFVQMLQEGVRDERVIAILLSSDEFFYKTQA